MTLDDALLQRIETLFGQPAAAVDRLDPTYVPKLASEGIPPHLFDLGALEELELYQCDFGGAGLAPLRYRLPRTLLMER